MASFLSVLPAQAADRAVETRYLGRPAHAWWETDTVGRWSSVSKAHEYQVKLYIADEVDRDEEDPQYFDPEAENLEAVMTWRTTELRCDFTDYMSDLHSYFFVVRAVPRLSEQAYVVSGEWTASKEQDFRGEMVQGITEGKWRNYLEGSRYEDGEGQFLPGGWQLIRGVWYLLDENGYRLSGWQTVDGKRYYLHEGGQMAVGWFVFGDDWYYAGKDGTIQTGWVMTLPGTYYYLYEDGRMAHDTEIDGYWLDENGLRQG